jgi:hypothetical protein
MLRFLSRGFLFCAALSAYLAVGAFQASAFAALTTLSTYGTPNPAAPAPSFVDNGGGSYSIVASGTDFWGTSDNGSWLYDPATTTSGDFTAIVRSMSFTTGDGASGNLYPLAGEWGRTGIMARASAAANSANVATVRKSGQTNGADGPYAILQQGRRYNGIATDRLVGESIGSGGLAANQNNAVWLALHRQGNFFYSQHAPDVGGAPGEWSAPRIRGVSPDLAGPLFVGLEHQAHSVPRVNQANFDNFSVGALDPSFGLPAEPSYLFTYSRQSNGKWNRVEIDEYDFLTFDAAVATSGSRTFNGLPGHLATPGSMEENRDLTGLISASRLRSEGLNQNAWIGVGDGAVEGEWRLLDASNQHIWQGLGSGAGGAPVGGAFTRWNGAVEPNNAGADPGEDAAELLRAGAATLGRWNDLPPAAIGQARFRLIEFETQLDTRPEIPALPAQNGNFSVHMIYNHRQDIQHVRAVEALAYSDGAGVQIGTHHHSYRPTINFKDEGSGDGLMPGGTAFPGSNPAVADENNFALFARGVVRITEAGVYTFGFHGDDGSQLRIPGHTFSMGINQPGGVGDTAANHGESDFVADGDVITFPRPTGSGTVLGQVFLPVGNHPIEFSFFENGGGAHSELFAAKGAHTTITGNPAFKPVGAREIPAMVKPEAVWETVTLANPPQPPAHPLDPAITNVEAYFAALDGGGDPAEIGYAVTSIINHADDFDGGGGKGFPQQIFPGLDQEPNVGDNDFAFGGRGVLTVTEEADYTFVVLADDSIRFRILGSSGWTGVAGPTGSALPDGFITRGCCSDATGTVHLTPGDHEMQLIMQEGGGGAYVGLFASMNGGPLFPLGESGMTPFVEGGLQLVPEPSTYALVGIALAAFAFARRRRAG